MKKIAFAIVGAAALSMTACENTEEATSDVDDAMEADAENMGAEMEAEAEELEVETDAAMEEMGDEAAEAGAEVEEATE